MRFCCYSAGKAFGLNRTDIFDGSKLFINQMVLSPIEKLNENWAKNAIENEWKTHGNRIYIIGQVDAEREVEVKNRISYLKERNVTFTMWETSGLMWWKNNNCSIYIQIKLLRKHPTTMKIKQTQWLW